MASTFLIFILHYIALISSTDLSIHLSDPTTCPYIHVSPDSFVYSGWYSYVNQEKKFGSNYFRFINNPHAIHLLLYEDIWYFYNWNNKEHSYTLSAANTASIHTVSSLFANHTTWNALADGSQIQLTLKCLQAFTGNIPSTTIIPYEEQLYWLINKQSCHDKSRGYIAFITDSAATTTSAYWTVPKLSNHTSNVTVSVSGDANEFALGQHKITYAAENKQYFIMCQITLYIIGAVSQQDVITKCIDLPDGRTSIMEWVIDHDTFLFIDTDQYEYDSSDYDAIQVQYVTPELTQRDITCYININWANIGEHISYSSVQSNTVYNDHFVAWKVLTVLCVISIIGLIIERVYFYRVIYNKSKYNSLNKEESELSLNMDDLDPLPIILDKKRAYPQLPPRSMSVSTGSVYNRFPVNYGDNNGIHRMHINNRAMSTQLNMYPFLEQTQKRANHINRRKQRYMSVPNNLMSDNTMKLKRNQDKKDNIASVWINDYDDDDFWKKELKTLKDAGFMNKKYNLSMLVKYVVKNEHQMIDKKMTESIVRRILEKENKANGTNKLKDEMEHFLENEWENKEKLENSVCSKSNDELSPNAKHSEVMM